MAKYAGVSNEAVAAKTGRGWEEWFQQLDRIGAQELEHKNIAILLREKFGVPDWWCQMITVGYEQARGMRAAHEKQGGFSAGVSKTFGVPVGRIFELWSEPAERTRWLGEAPMEVRKETLNRSMRIAWREPDGSKTRVDVYFYDKGAGKCQVALQHEQLPGPMSVDEKKGYWKAAFSRLAELTGE